MISSRWSVAPSLLALACGLSLQAQPIRLSRPIQQTRFTALPGHLHPLARRGTDEGTLDGATSLPLLSLVLRPTEQQQRDLEMLLATQQDPNSPDYHRWLSPEEFGDRFGVSKGDLARITAWLEAQGFTVEELPPSRNWVAFRGTATQVNAAFGADLHRFRVDGREHYAPTREPVLPGDLADLVTAVRGLHDFALQPKHQRRLADPNYTNGNGSANLAPDDLAVIYNLNPLYKAGFDGTGQKIAIAGQTSLNLADIRAFRTRFGLPARDPQLVLYGTDPGVSGGDLVEADLDVEWSGAVARNATVVYVYSRDVFTSVQYAVSKNLAPVISFSYGACEKQEPASAGTMIQQVAKQANAQGITWLASSGDSGAASCQEGGAGSATTGLAASFPASVPEITAVGGTQFNEGSGKYWGANGSNGGSALSYIPEKAWNESGPGSGLWSTGGGVSLFFPKPAWQTGPGVPSTATMRLIPDVSMSAAMHDGYLVVSSGNTYFVGGTSASSPVFAGLLTMLNQYLVSKGIQAAPGLGNANPMLYSLAQSTTGIFHDITVGDNKVPCTTGSLNCTGGTLGYATGAGYDMATGLGSVDGNALVTQWSAPSKVVGTAITLTADAASIVTSATVKLTAVVKPASGTGVPGGDVTFKAGTTSLGTASLASGTATLSVAATKLALGANAVTATYAGNASFTGSSSSATTVTVTQPVAASSVSAAVAPSPVYQTPADAKGNTWVFSVTLSETAGAATTLTGFTIDAIDYTSTIASLFGSSAITAKGTLTAKMGMKGLTVPAVKLFKFTGKDTSGRVWTQQVSVSFNGPAPNPKLALISLPATVNKNPAATADCQWMQELHLSETNGFPVELTAFQLGTTDYSKQIASMFGASKLGPYGDLAMRLCWRGLTAPTTIPYRVDGTDSAGNKTSATLTSSYQVASTANSVLTVPSIPIPLQVATATARPATATLKVGLTGTKQDWSVLVITPNAGTPWLTVSGTSGSGSTTLTLTANGANLPVGTYQGTVVVQAANAVPQWVSVPVLFTVGAASATGVTKAK